MCGPQGKTIQVPLSFLGENEYKAVYVRDVKDDPAAVSVEKSAAKRGDTLTIEMPNGGGFVGQFSKK